jgi:hypothetical protein
MALHLLVAALVMIGLVGAFAAFCWICDHELFVPVMMVVTLVIVSWVIADLLIMHYQLK